MAVSTGKGSTPLSHEAPWKRRRAGALTQLRMAGGRSPRLDNRLFLQQCLLLYGAQVSSQTLQIIHMGDPLGLLHTPGIGQPMAAKAGCFLEEADGTWVTVKVWVRLGSEVRNALLKCDPLWSAPTLPSSPLQ